MIERNISILLWLLPIALTLHVTEEFFFPGGFREWIRACKPRRLMSNRYYVIINAVAIIATVIIALVARGIVGYMMYLYAVALMVGNAATHIRGTLQTKRYCPGSVTGGLLFLPLLLISCSYFVWSGALGWPLAVLWTTAGLGVGAYLFGVDIRKADREQSARL